MQIGTEYGHFEIVQSARDASKFTVSAMHRPHIEAFARAARLDTDTAIIGADQKFTLEIPKVRVLDTVLDWLGSVTYTEITPDA